jgi:hypothetical protein
MKACARRTFVVAGAVAAVAVASVATSLLHAAPAAQDIGAVANDVFAFETIGTAVGTAADAMSPRNLLIFGGQAADGPESIADMTADLTALEAASSVAR